MKTSAPFVLILLAAIPAIAQPPAPAPPQKYKVSLRYYIPAPRDQHVAQYDAMIAHLVKVGFEFDPPLEKHADTDREDPSKNYLTGYIASPNLRRLLDPLVVQSVLAMPFAPEEFKLPDEGDAPVTVRLDLAGNLSPDRQRELSNQTRVLLRELGFKEPAGYDHRGPLPMRRSYTRIVGTIPKGKLDLLNRDLRKQPAGWLGPIIKPNEIPSPLRDINPVQLIEVLPDGAAVKELPDPEFRFVEDNEKIGADLWAMVRNKEVPPTQVRVQIGFVGAITGRGREWKTILPEMTPGFFIEGQNGPFVTGIIRLDQVKTLVQSPLVSFIRLPRAPLVDVDLAIQRKGDNAKALEQAGLKELHERGYLGKGVRVAIIDRDFRGWEELVKKKQLPAQTRLVDLTTEADPEIYPQPYRDLKAIGHGTLCAQAAALAAPAAELVLIRVDVVDPYQLNDVLRYFQGGRPSNTIEQRNGELMARAAQLSARRAFLLKERQLILNDFTDETDERDSLGFLGPLYAWLYSDREWHRQRMDYHAKLEEEHRLRENRYRKHLKEIDSLNGVPIVVNSLAWNSGFPLGAASPLSRALDVPSSQRGSGDGGEGNSSPLWFQSAGNTRGQSWFGPYRGVVGDPAMKFVDERTKLPKGRWSEEVNFLAWQPHLGETISDLPPQTKVRLTMQWREPHDPDYYLLPGDEDFYRQPLAAMSLQLLRQRDPDTKKLRADFFDRIAQTGQYPQRIEHMPNGSVYEHVLEVPLAEAGRYAIRVEKQVSSVWVFKPNPQRKAPMYFRFDGLTPTGIRPLRAPTLPAVEKDWDLRLRIFVEVLDDANRLKGRAVFADFPMNAGSIGLPMDARNVISVGAASLSQKPQAYSAFGTPMGMELAARPWLYAYDELELAGGGAYGASIANAFAAGTTAAMMSGRLSRDDVVQMLRAQEGQVLRVPVGKR